MVQGRAYAMKRKNRFSRHSTTPVNNYCAIYKSKRRFSRLVVFLNATLPLCIETTLKLRFMRPTFRRRGKNSKHFVYLIYIFR